MALDRFVRWKKEKPTREQIQLVVEDYVRDLAESVTWDEEGSRFFVKLPGMGSHPAARIAKSPELADMYAQERANERWFEVYIDDDSIDVITRRGDWITNSIADTFAKICAQFWSGKLEME